MPAAGLRGPTPLLRLQTDERLVALTRKGNQAAYEALVARYQSRLLSFCRHMLGSKEDAEDVLQEVFAASFNAMLADERAINVRPWLYRIARNRSLNHLRKQQAIGVDSMDVLFADNGKTTAEKVQGREEFRLLLSDVNTLPETQRTALLLREIDALSYEQISEAMETTVPSVKSLLVRARVSLAEAAEARAMTCEQVREQLGEVAEGLVRMSPPVRRHVKQCDPCHAFRDHLKDTNRALAAIFPIGPLVMLKKFLLAQVGTTAGASSAASAGAGAGAAAGAAGAGSALTTGVGVVASKAAAGLAAVAIVGAGAVEVDHAAKRRVHRGPANAAAVAPVAPPVVAPEVVASAPQPVSAPAARRHKAHRKARDAKTEQAATTTPATTSPAPGAATPADQPQQESDTTTLPPSTPPGEGDSTGGMAGPAPSGDPAAQPTTTSEQPPPPDTSTTTTTTEQPPPPDTTTTSTTEQPPPGS